MINYNVDNNNIISIVIKYIHTLISNPDSLLILLILTESVQICEQIC